MPKKIIQDVIPPENKKSIRNISLPTRKPKTFDKNFLANETSPKEISFKKNDNTDYSKPTLSTTKTESNVSEVHKIPTLVSVETSPRSGVKRKVVYYSFLTIFIGTIIYLLVMFLNVGATINIENKVRSVNINTEISAKSNPQEGELSFEVLEISEELSKTAPASGEKKIEKKATGVVILYNNFSTANQRIIKNTRLETADGKIYRIDNSVVIPGQKNEGGKMIPGSVEVTATADAPGEKYNIELSDFTIPGFKDEPDKFDKYYARSKTNMSGGYSGTIKTATPEDREITQKEVVALLKANLLKKAKEQTPQNLVLFDNAVFYTTESLTPAESNEVKIRMTLHGIMFDRELLAKHIAKEALPQYDESERVTLKNIDKLSFKPNSLEVTPWLTGVMPFLISGNVDIYWLVDEVALIDDLTGLPKTSSQNVFETYKGIEKATVTITPAWKSTFPEDKNKIKIVFEKEVGVGTEESAPQNSGN